MSKKIKKLTAGGTADEVRKKETTREPVVLDITLSSDEEGSNVMEDYGNNANIID